MEPEVTVDDLLSIAQESGDYNPDQEESEVSLEELLSIARESGDYNPEANNLFTADEYYAPPGLLQRMGITNIDENNPIYQNLMTDPKFREAEPKDRRRMFAEAVDDANQALYERQGEEVNVGIVADAFGDGTNPRVQTGVDADGQEQTYIVPAPGSRGIDALVGENAGTAIRSITGGVVQAGRMLAGLPEAVADQVGSDEEDNAVNTTRQNFPLIPPENEYDAMGQEITSMIVGGIGGAGLADKLAKAYNLTPKMATWVSKGLGKLKGKSPAEVADAARVMSRIIIAGTGANFGGAATTPEETQPLVGDDIVEAFGIDPDENRYLGNLADNVAFSSLLTVLGRLGSKVIKPVKSLARGLGGTAKSRRDMGVGLVVLKNLDTNLVNAPSEIVGERARIMGDVLLKNKEFSSALLSDTTIPVDSLTALRSGIEEYVDRAYAFQKTLMTDKEWADYSSNLTRDIVSRMADLRTNRAGSAAVRNKDADTALGMQKALDNTASEIGGVARDAVTETAEDLGGPIVRSLEDATERLDNATVTRDLVATQLDAAANRNVITDALVEAKRADALGSDQTQRALLEKLSGPQLYDAWKQSYTGYRDAFNDLPNDIPLPVEEFVALVREAYPDPKQWPNIIDQVTLTETVEDPLRTLLRLVTPKVDEGTAGMATTKSPGNITIEDYDEMIQRLTDQGTSFKQVYTELRPALELRIKALLDNPGLSTQADPLITLKQGIDTIAESIGDPAFIQAKEAYQRHAETWLNTRPLRQYSAATKQVVENAPGPITGVAKGLPDAYKAGLDALKQSVDEDFTPYAEAFIRALNSGVDDSLNPELSEAYIGLAMNALSRSVEAGQTVTTRAIKDATQPYVNQLKRIGGGVYERWNSVVQDLEALESGVISAEKALANMAEAKAGILSQAQKDVAARFVRNLSSDPKIRENPQAVFKEIFRSNDSIDITRELLKRAEEQNNPMVRAGMQTAFLDDLNERLFVSKGIGLDAEDATNTARQVSEAQLTKILNNPSSPTLRTLQLLFEDNPERAVQVVRLLEIQELSTSAKNLRGDNRGSTTAIDTKITYDQDLKKLMDRIVTLRYGVLNTKATVYRNILNAITKGATEDIQAAAKETLTFMTAEPVEFDRVLALVAKGQEETAMEIMTKWAVRSAGAGYKIKQSNLDQETQEALPVE